MSIYKGSEKLKDITIGSTKIDKVYKGSTLVFLKRHYTAGQTLFEKTAAGTYTFSLAHPARVCITLVGGGGGGISTSNSGGNGFAAGGGSGGYSYYETILEKGNYTVVVGDGGARALYGQDNTDHTAGNGGDSSITIPSGRLYAQGGRGGFSRYQSNYGGASTGGAGGWGNAKSGKQGQRVGEAYNTATDGGASVYNGYGKGGNGCATNPGGSLQGNTTNGGTGYVKIHAK